MCGIRLSLSYRQLLCSRGIVFESHSYNNSAWLTYWLLKIWNKTVIRSKSCSVAMVRVSIPLGSPTRLLSIVRRRVFGIAGFSIACLLSVSGTGCQVHRYFSSLSWNIAGVRNWDAVMDFLPLPFLHRILPSTQGVKKFMSTWFISVDFNFSIGMESCLQYTVFEFGFRKVAGLFQSLSACCKGQYIIHFEYRAVFVGKST